MELPEDFRPEPEPVFLRIPMEIRNILAIIRRFSIPLTLVAGIGLIAAGIITRETISMPAIWVSGIVLLWMLPLQICVIPGRGAREELGW